MNTYCNFIDINNNWICTQCGATVPQSVVSEKPFAVCKLVINNNRTIKEITNQRGTPFGYMIDDKIPLPSIPQDGPGTELKKLLRYIGISITSNCKCKDRAIKMNEWGVEKCEKNIETIVDWLQEEAKRRRLPFLRIAAKLLVKRAIKNARNQ